VALLRFQAELLENVGRYWNLIDLFCDNLKGGGLENDLGIGFVELGGNGLGGGEQALEGRLAAPAVDGPAESRASAGSLRMLSLLASI